MLELRTFEAKILRLNEILLSWSIAPTEEDLGNFRFDLGRSNSPGGPFEPISSPLVNVFQFIDVAEQMKSNWRKLYWQLTVTDTVGGAEKKSPVISTEGKPDFFLLEIRRRNDLYLKRYVGVPAAVLIRKTFGQRCAQCFDNIKQREKISKCFTCFGSGFVGGYFPQVNGMVNFSPSPEMVQLIETGERQPNQTNLWLSYYPEISARDMIVEFPEQRRWRVVTVGKTERLRVTSRQIAQVVEINRSDVEYLVPVNEVVPKKETFLGFRPPDGSGLL